MTTILVLVLMMCVCGGSRVVPGAELEEGVCDYALCRRGRVQHTVLPRQEQGPCPPFPREE
eukprot:3128086-Rhodomonas_salina.1